MAVRIVATDVFGRNPFDVQGWSQVEWVNTVNKIGPFTIRWPRESYPARLFRLDRRILIYRAPRGRAERLVYAGFMRKYQETSERGVYVKDYSDERTVIYYGGSEQQTARLFAVGATNAERLLASALNRREGFNNDSDESDTNILEDGSASMLYDHRPVIEFSPRNIELNYIYDADWRLGDVLRVRNGNVNEYAIGGPDLTDILKRRIVAYKTGTSESKKSGVSDDMLKEYVDENLVNATDTDRNLNTDLGFEIAADDGAGATVDHSAKFGNLLKVCQAVAEKSAEAGTRLFFQVRPVIRSGRVVPRLETRITQWGQDRTSQLRIGTGDSFSDLMAIGVRVVATRQDETVTPIFENIDD
jgi:hypothetical protein